MTNEIGPVWEDCRIPLRFRWWPEAFRDVMKLADQPSNPVQSAEVHRRQVVSDLARHVLQDVPAQVIAP